MMPLAGGLAKSLGKRMGKATSKAGSHLEIYTFLMKFLRSKMIKFIRRKI